MSSPETHHDEAHHVPEDPIEAVVPAIPIVLPMVGAGLMFLLAWIAIYMA